MDIPLLLEMPHATVYRRTLPVLHDLSLEIALGHSTVILGPDGYVRLLGQDTWNVWGLRSQLGFLSADMQQGYPATSGLDIILSGFFSNSGMSDYQADTLRQRHLSLEMMNYLGIGHF